MPYKNETLENAGNNNASFPVDEDSHHTAQGAGLLLSLSSCKRNTSLSRTTDDLDHSSTNIATAMNPITPMEGYSRGAPAVAGVTAGGNHRLYHSPIKLNKETRAAEEASSRYSSSSISSSSTDRLRCPPSWSPYQHPHAHHQHHFAMRQRHMYHPPQFAPFPTDHLLEKRHVSNEHEDNSPLQARSAEFGDHPKEENGVHDADGKEQPVISPASSNEKRDEEEEDEEDQDTEDDEVSPQKTSSPPPHHPPHWPHHHHPHMYPPWQGQLGFPPPHHHPYPPPPPPPHYSSNGYPYPPPWYGSGAPPYPPFPQRETAEPATKETNPKDEVDWEQVDSTSLKRCVPLKHPPRNRYWGNRNLLAEQALPDFARLVNFPDFLTKGRGNGPPANADGKKNCVMCGKERVCSVAGRRKHEVETTHIIPRQNKGVCTQCDVTVWLVLDERMEVKWCKGCKNLRPWAAFGEKGMATKCLRCRHRQKEKYATQKKLDDGGGTKGVRHVTMMNNNATTMT